MTVWGSDLCSCCPLPTQKTSECGLTGNRLNQRLLCRRSLRDTSGKASVRSIRRKQGCRQGRELQYSSNHGVSISHRDLELGWPIRNVSDWGRTWSFSFSCCLKKKKKLKDNCFTVFVKNLQFYNTVNIVKYVSAIHQHESAIGIHMSASSGTVLPPPTAPNNSRFLSFLVVIGWVLSQERCVNLSKVVPFHSPRQFRGKY